MRVRIWSYAAPHARKSLRTLAEGLMVWTGAFPSVSLLEERALDSELRFDKFASNLVPRWLTLVRVVRQKSFDMRLRNDISDGWRLRSCCLLRRNGVFPKEGTLKIEEVARFYVRCHLAVRRLKKPDLATLGWDVFRRWASGFRTRAGSVVLRSAFIG